MLEIYDKFGRCHTLRAIIDSDSATSFITRKFASKFCLASSRLPIFEKGVGCAFSFKTFGKLCNVCYRPINLSPILGASVYTNIILPNIIKMKNKGLIVLDAIGF